MICQMMMIGSFTTCGVCSVIPYSHTNIQKQTDGHAGPAKETQWRPSELSEASAAHANVFVVLTVAEAPPRMLTHRQLLLIATALDVVEPNAARATAELVQGLRDTANSSVYGLVAKSQSHKISHTHEGVQNIPTTPAPIKPHASDTVFDTATHH